MTKLERLGNICTNTICHKECPIYYFRESGAGKGTGNNCVESMRFPNVARNVELWLEGKTWSKAELDRWEDDE